LNIYQKTVSSVTSSVLPSPTRTLPQPTLFRSLGCYSEATNSRALNLKSSNDDAMTIEKCAATCSGYKYFGLEYYFQCFCGNVLQPGSVQVDSSECKNLCTGNSKQICGGDSRLNLYSFGDSPETTLSLATSTTTTIAPTSTPYPGYFTTGCYTEATTQRALSKGSFYNDYMTIETCAAACSGFALFGVEYGRECYCGNSLNSGSVSTSTGECNTVCPGNKAQFCGAGNRLNVYKYGLDPSPSRFSTAVV